MDEVSTFFKSQIEFFKGKAPAERKPLEVPTPWNCPKCVDFCQCEGRTWTRDGSKPPYVVWEDEQRETMQTRLEFLLSMRNALSNRDPKNNSKLDQVTSEIFRRLTLEVVEQLGAAISEAINLKLASAESLKASLLELLGDQVAEIAAEVVTAMKGRKK